MKKILSLLTAVCMLICICPFGMSAHADDSDEVIPYIRYEWTGGKLKKVTDSVSLGDADVVLITETSTSDCLEMGGGKFYVFDKEGIIRLEQRTRVGQGETANIILEDGCYIVMTAGIEVPYGSTLNIYAQSDREAVRGFLKALAPYDGEGSPSYGQYKAAIGSNGTASLVGCSGHGMSGTINIHSGSVSTNSYYGAGIGGGNDDSGGEVNIYGGYVKASSSYGAGIGSGHCNGSGGIGGGNVTVYGGVVSAWGGSDALASQPDGIGGGRKGNNSTSNDREYLCYGANVEICGGIVDTNRIYNDPINENGDRVYKVEIPKLSDEDIVTVNGISYNMSYILIDQYCVYLPEGKSVIGINDDLYRVTVGENGENCSVDLIVCDSSHSLNTNKVNCLGGICSECGKFFYGDHTPADPVIENETEAVCEKGGSYDEVVYCSVCGKEISRETIETEALGHIEDEGTETADGTVYKCKVCKEVLRTVPKQEDKPNDDKPKDNVSRRDETPSGNTSNNNNNTSYTTPSTPSSPSAPSYKPATFVPAPEIKTDITIENGKAKLEWNKIDGASEYIIYEENNGKLTEVKRTKDLSAELKYKSGTTYIVKYVKNGVISSTSKSRAEIKADKPVVSANVGTDFVKFTWQDMSADKYIVYKYIDGKAVKIGEVTKTSVKITGLKPDTEYSYIISAVIDGEETVKLKSDVITVRTMKENAS